MGVGVAVVVEVESVVAVVVEVRETARIEAVEDRLGSTSLALSAAPAGGDIAVRTERISSLTSSAR